MLRVILILLLIVSCKPQKEVVKTHFVSDTLIHHETKEIILPVKNITILDSPCKDSILKPINQTIKTEHSTLTIKSEGQKLVIEQDIDSIVNSRLEKILKQTEKKKEVVTITKYKVPKWSWWLLGITAFYILYRVLRLQFPFLRILPI